MNDQSNEARLIAVIGATGSGKGVYIKTELIKKSDRRLLIWDFMREYGPLVDKTTASIAELVKSLKAKTFKVAFTPSHDDKLRAAQFDLFCRAAYAAGKCKMVIEELSFVTKPTSAPAGWRKVSCTGRHVGLEIIGVSQRPAQVDKDFFGNCSEIHCGFLNYLADIKTMANVLGVANSDISGLEPLQYIHKHVRTKKIYTGIVKIPGKS